MIARLIFWLIGCALVAGCAAPSAERIAAAAASAQLAIVGVTVVPMSGTEAVLPDRTVVVRDGRIARIGPRSLVRVPSGAQVVEGRGRFLMPALADAHVHLEYVEDPDVLKLFLGYGVATVRSMDGRPFILEWRDRVAAGELLGPRIVTAGPIIDGSPPARDDNLAVATASAARAAVAEQAARGYDFVKLYSNLSAAAYDAAVAEARVRRLRVAGHVPRAVPLGTAIAAQWSIEHLGDFAAELAAEGASTPGWARRSLAAPLDERKLAALAAQLAARGTWLVPTSIQQDRWLAPAARVDEWLAEPWFAYLPAPVIAQWRAGTARFAGRLDADDWQLLDRARSNRLRVIAAMHRAGVRIAVGSDTPNPFVPVGAAVHMEMRNFVDAGLTPLQALRAATIDVARMLGLEAEQGSVEVGKRADLLLLDRNPLEDASHTTRPAGLIVGGRWFDEAGLSALRRSLGEP